MNSKNLLFVFIGVYLVGCALSQSLMSLGGTVFIAFFIVLAFPFSRTASPKGLGSAYFFFSLYILTNAISSGLGGIDSHKALDAIKTLPLFGLLLLPFFGTVQELSKKHLDTSFFRKLSLLALAAYGVSVSISLYQSLVLRMQGSGVFGNPIYYAYGLLPALAFFAQTLYRRPSLISWALLVILSIGVVLSGNRMCLLVLPLLWLFPLLKLKHAKILIPLAAIAGILSIGGLYRHHEVYTHKLERTLSGGDISIRARLHLWRHNWGLIQEAPLIGKGYQSNAVNTEFDKEFQEYWKPGFDIFAHNLYLQELAQSGVVGLLALIGLFGLLLWQFGLNLPLLASLIAGLTENTFNNSKALHPFLFFTLLAMLQTIYLRSERRSD